MGLRCCSPLELDRGPSIVRTFAIAAMFWLMVLLGLGSADPLTRTDYVWSCGQAERTGSRTTNLEPTPSRLSTNTCP